MRISDWSSDVCSSDLGEAVEAVGGAGGVERVAGAERALANGGHAGIPFLLYRAKAYVADKVRAGAGYLRMRGSRAPSQGLRGWGRGAGASNSVGGRTPLPLRAGGGRRGRSTTIGGTKDSF